jgi:hypothetical protein
MTQLAIKLTPPLDLAPWRIPLWGDEYQAIVDAAASEVTLHPDETLTEALRRFGYERATVDGRRVTVRNGVVKRLGDCRRSWIWLARVKRRIQGRRG